MNKRATRIIMASLTVAALLLVGLGCNRQKTAEAPFSRDQAIRKATDDAKRSAPELGIQTAQVNQVTVELITLQESDRRRGLQTHEYGLNRDAHTPVWWVRVEGNFRYTGMPLPGGVYPIYEADEQFLIYDARTGDLLGRTVPRSRLISPTAVRPTSR